MNHGGSRPHASNSIQSTLVPQEDESDVSYHFDLHIYSCIQHFGQDLRACPRLRCVFRRRFRFVDITIGRPLTLIKCS